MRGQGARDFFGGGADIDEQRAAIRNQRRGGGTNGLFLLGGDETARLIGQVLDPRGDDGAAMNPGQRAVIAEVVEILADGLRRNLETPGEILHHHPAKGAGDVQDFSLTMRETSQRAPGHKDTPWCDCSASRSTRQIDIEAGSGTFKRILVKATYASSFCNGPGMLVPVR